MRMKTAFLALIVLLAATAAVEAKSFTLKKVRGTLDAPEDDSDAKGRFMLGIVLAGDDTRERLVVVAKKLDADTEYEVLLGDSLEKAVSFGELKVRKRGYGWLKVRKDDFPEDVDSLVDFSGANLYVVADEETVLEGEIPEFVDPVSDDDAGEGSFAFGFGEAALSVPDGSDDEARGRITVAAVNTPRGAREMVTILAARLERGETYDVYLVSDDADDEELGSFKTRKWLGFGVLVVDTGREGELPDHVGELAGRTVEVRNADGDTVLTGEFPSID